MLAQVHTLLLTTPNPQLEVWANMLEGDLLHLNNEAAQA
jgi:hypothetical protein